jgi:hypothetical protein
MPRTARHLTGAITLVAVLGVVGVAGCGGDDGAADEPADDAAATTSAPSTTAAVPTTGPSTSTGAPPTTVPGPEADVVLEVVVEGGSVVAGGGRASVPLGSSVALVVTSDVDEEIHLHGYDVELPLAAGVPGVLAFTADIPGVFEVELHGSGLGIWDLQIS